MSILCGLPASAGAQSVPSDGYAEDVRTSALAVAHAWVEAWNEADEASMARLHDAELLYYWRGSPRGYDTFMAELREFIFPHETYATGMVDARVQVLGPDAAVVGFLLGDLLEDDTVGTPGAAFTLVVVRRDDWKILHIHESPVRE